MEASRTQSPLTNPLMDLREMEERVRMHQEEKTGSVEEEGEDDAISSTTPECSRTYQEDNDSQPERMDNRQKDGLDELSTVDNKNNSIVATERNDNSPLPAMDSTGDNEDFDSSSETGSPAKSAILDLSCRGDEEENDGRKEENLLEIDPHHHRYNNDLIISCSNKQEESLKVSHVYEPPLSCVAGVATPEQRSSCGATDLQSFHPPDKSASEIPRDEQGTSPPVTTACVLPKPTQEAEDSSENNEPQNFHQDKSVGPKTVASSLIATPGPFPLANARMSLSHLQEKPSTLQSRPSSIPPPESTVNPVKISRRAPSLPPGGHQQKPEVSENDTISGSIFAHHPTAVRLTPMGGIACTPIQRLLQPGVAEARQDINRVDVMPQPSMTDAGATTSAAGRPCDDEKPITKGQDLATKRRSKEGKREGGKETNPCLEGDSMTKEFLVPEATMSMEKEIIMQNHETMSDINARKRERCKNLRVLPPLVTGEQNGGKVQKRSNQDRVEEQMKQQPRLREIEDDRVHHDISIDEADGGQEELGDQEDDGGEIVMNLDQVSGGQKMKFNIPGISQVI